MACIGDIVVVDCDAGEDRASRWGRVTGGDELRLNGLRGGGEAVPGVNGVPIKPKLCLRPPSFGGGIVRSVRIVLTIFFECLSS